MRVPRRLTIALIGLAGCQPALPSAEPALPADRPGIHNLLPVGDGLWSGSVPEGDQGFQSLQALGVHTVISVDGARPDVERAHRFGLRYVHIPIGYGGVTRERALRLARAAAQCPGPIYVHCHHGKHRGPAAAALICLSRDRSWTGDDAVDFLHRAGTDRRYEGLYAAVREFRMPSSDELHSVPADFPEVAPVAGLAAAMVDLDDAWTRLKDAGKADRKQSVGLAVLVVEHFREIQRLPEVGSKGDDFRRLLKEAGAAAEELEAALGGTDTVGHDRALARCESRCAACHQDHRDRAPR